MSKILRSYENKNIFYLIVCSEDIQYSEELEWLFRAWEQGCNYNYNNVIGPRINMVTPFSTNVCEILHNLGISEVSRVEKFIISDGSYDNLTQEEYLLSDLIHIFEYLQDVCPRYSDSIIDINRYNVDTGLALSHEEIKYLEQYARKRGTPITEAEIFGFSQVNSEHCRHKIFNGEFIINGVSNTKSLFNMIRDTTENSFDQILSAYSDNVAFVKSPNIMQFSVEDKKLFKFSCIMGAISLKAETHNFPTTVCAFPGAATGSGGEIRDRMGGGIGSIPGVGIAGYFTPYARVSSLSWEKEILSRSWKYQNPIDILIQASNGASDYGNKFGQPLIAGTVTTYEIKLGDSIISYDKVIMFAGGVGHTNLRYVNKKVPYLGDKIILLGGDNYRIGIGGGSVSSLNTGECSNFVEFNAVQRANPEMQNRVNRVIRTLVEDINNPIKIIHDHGAGGHFNCLSELVKDSGAIIDMDKLPLGDKTLTDSEILSNESQERMAIIVQEKDVAKVVQVAKREQCPVYIIGECTDKGNLIFRKNTRYLVQYFPVSIPLEVLFDDPPKKIINCSYEKEANLKFDFPNDSIKDILINVLRLTKVASKEWLTHKVDRSVTGLVAQQQTVGPYQLPLSNVAVKALDYIRDYGIAIGIGDRPIPGIISVEAGIKLSIGESLTNIVWAPLKEGIKSVVLSANWMWPCGQKNEDAKLYKAVEAFSKTCIGLGIPVPTGKDSLSMTQKYDDGFQVKAPGTVVVTATGVCSNINQVVTPDIKKVDNTYLLYIPFQNVETNLNLDSLGTSAVAQIYNTLGGSESSVPTLNDYSQFITGFNVIQILIKEGKILAGHDISEGGILTTLVEMAISGGCGLDINKLNIGTGQPGLIFYEGLGVIIQIRDEDFECIKNSFNFYGQDFKIIAYPNFKVKDIRIDGSDFKLSVDYLRRVWSLTSFDMDKYQMSSKVVEERKLNLDFKMKDFKFPRGFNPLDKLIVGKNRLDSIPINDRVKAAIIREKGTNGDREMAYALYHAGFEVKDITMVDILEFREDLTDVSCIVFCGGFSNSDVLGSARGWASIFKFNPLARKVLTDFYERKDTISLSVCNGNQLAILLNLIEPDKIFGVPKISMEQNDSKIFESRFVPVTINGNNSIFLKGLEGCTLGVWVAHSEGKYKIDTLKFPLEQIVMEYSKVYPFNPNGSNFNTAGVSSKDGRHLMMMPHPERSIFPWQWGYYPYAGKRTHLITPWIILFKNAFEWCLNKSKSI